GPEADLPGLTAGATAFIYPSIYEGFGFPVAQAMAAGVPIVTSNVSSLPEITAGAAMLVDPRSPSELAAAISRVLEAADLRTDLSARGREVAQRYRWERCAEESLQFFRRVAGGGLIRPPASGGRRLKLPSQRCSVARYGLIELSVRSGSCIVIGLREAVGG